MQYVYEFNEFNFYDENELLDNNNYDYWTIYFILNLKYIFEYNYIFLINFLIYIFKLII